MMPRSWFTIWSRVRAQARSGEHAFDPRVVLLSMVLTVVCTLPLWLTGALAVQMRAELNFGILALGGAVGLHRVAGAALSAPLGRLSDRLGPTPAMRTAACLAAAASFGVAAVARSWLGLIAFLAVSGASNALGQTAANLALVRAVPADRQGIAFGVKQAALPAGAMLSGLAVPFFALTVGWRWAFVAAGVLSLVVVVAVPRGPAAPYQPPEGTANRSYGQRPLIVLAVGLFFAMSAASSLTTFTVESSTTAGVNPALAGLLLTVGSIVSIVTRLVAGAVADHREGRHLERVAFMLLAGMFGYVLLALSDPVWIVLGSLIAFSLGWGFNGLFWYAIVRLNQATPAAATGMIMPGGMLGGVAGPLAFGWLVETYSYPVAWLGAASWALSAGLLLLLGRRLLVADLRMREAAPRAG